MKPGAGAGVIRSLIALALLAGISAFPLAAQDTAPAEIESEEATAAAEAPAADGAAVEEVVIEQETALAEPPVPADPVRIDRYDTSVQIFSGLTVEADEVYEEAVAIMGPLTIDGVVNGDAVAVGGPVRVSGTVRGELVSIGGPVHLTSSARVGRLVNVGGNLTKEEGAVVDGAIEDHGGSGFSINISDGELTVDTDDHDHEADVREYSDRSHRSVGFFDSVGEFFAALIGNLVFLTLLIFMLAVAAVLAPRLIDRTSNKLTTDPWKAAVAGVLTEIGFLPALVAGCIFLVISVVGILLLPAFIPLMFLALLVAALVGFAAVAQHIGGLVAERFEWNLPGRVVRIAVGTIALHVMWMLGWVFGLLPGGLSFIGGLTMTVGVLILFIAWTTGLGGLLLAAFDPPQPEAVTAAPAPGPPPPIPVLDDEPAVEEVIGSNGGEDEGTLG